MNNEFKKSKNNQYTVYTLESATSGGTSAGSIASVSSPIGGVRKRGDNLIAQEGDKDKVDATKPRNFVAKNAKMGGAGQHKDKKKAEKQGDVKHKNKSLDMAEGMAGMDDAEPYTIGGAVDKQYVYTVMRDGKSMGIYHSLDDAKSIVANNKRTNKYSEFKIQRKPRSKMAGPVGQLPEQGVAEGLPQTLRKIVPGYAKREIDKKMDAGKFGKTDADKDANFHRYKKIQDKLKEQGVAEVAGPEKCWPGHRKVGTKPGTGKNAGKRVNDCEKIGEQDMSEDHEIQMASSELQAIAKNAVNLLDLVRKYSEQDGLQAWQQSKITKAADYLNSVLQSISGEQNNLEEGMSDYVGDAIEGLRMSNPGLEKEDFLDELYMYIENQYGQRAAEMMSSAGQDAYDEWYDSYSDMAEDHSNMAQGFGSNGYRTAQAQSIRPGAGHNMPVEEDEYMAELFNKLAEKIPANAPVDVWVKDFQKADPNKYHQFKNKTPEKKAQMAVAASYDAKNPSKKKNK